MGYDIKFVKLNTDVSLGTADNFSDVSQHGPTASYMLEDRLRILNSSRMLVTQRSPSVITDQFLRISIQLYVKTVDSARLASH
jgi:hypothetical protein